ncbi:DEAD/DEAH box helicase family protein [Pontibacillus sp. HMF3514]|nr:DEAD/DEAH box helicase family protein [Pontibacillus sp. HMF3514]
MNKEEKETLLSKGLLQRVPVIEEHVWGYLCRRCGNKKRRWFAGLPCGCEKECVYCRKCIEMGRVSSCSQFLVWTGSESKWERSGQILKWNGELTYYQKRASDEIRSAIDSKNDLLVWAVCGAGKTEMLFEGLAHALAEGKRVCVATPRADVVKELFPRFREVFSYVNMVSLYGGSQYVDEGAQLVLSTTHQLLRYARAFDVLIIDEVDAFPFYADTSLLWASRRAKKIDAATIYLTATPRIRFKILSKLKKLQTVFVPQRFHGHPLPVPRFVSCFGWKSSLDKNTLPRKFKRWLDEKEVGGRRILVFAPTIALAEQLADLIPGGVYVHSEDENREKKVQQFRNLEISILISTAILERGVTFPSIDVAVFHAGHRNFDEAALVQIAGRAGRSANDPNGDVVFFHDGKSEAMVEARYSILNMNDLARKGGR